MANQEITRRAALGAAGAALGTVAMSTTTLAQDAKEGGESERGLKLFQKVDPSMMIKGAPPLVFHPTPNGHIVFRTQEALKAWEDEVRSRLGVQLRGEVGSASESCSGGCSDDCDDPYTCLCGTGRGDDYL